MGPIEHLILEF